ncbi:unnamed protein product, partial [Iphiclides podalirius]
MKRENVGLRNCRNELEAALCSAEECARALELQKGAAAEAAAQRDLVLDQLEQLEAELLRREALLASAEAEAAALRRDSEEKQRALEWATHRLKLEHECVKH